MSDFALLKVPKDPIWDFLRGNLGQEFLFTERGLDFDIDKLAEIAKI